MAVATQLLIKDVGHGRGRRGRHGGRHGGRGGRTVRVPSDVDGDEERDAAIAEGGLEDVLPPDGAESEGMSLALALQMMMMMHQQMMG
eukprot:1621-Chlamydomonas_euryale.AAC.1